MMAQADSDLCGAMQFIREMAWAVVEESRVRPGESVGEFGPNSTGGTLIKPGGRGCYPAFWIRDFAMSLESEIISCEEQEHAVRLTARLQSPADWRTPSGSFVPRGAIADHITLEGRPIYFPGGNIFEEQGQPLGYYPSLDDHFYFIEMVWRLATVERNPSILHETIDGLAMHDRLELAFAVPTSSGESPLVWCEESTRGVSFGFHDVVVHTGYLLFCSILKWRAAMQLADLLALSNKAALVPRYRAIAKTIAQQIPRVFADKSGLLRASTGKSAQPDVWGSAFALYAGVLDEENADLVARALLRAYLAGTISWRGAIRHVPTDCDFGPGKAWEQIVNDYCAFNRYQNGAYWSTPTGWVCYALAQVDMAAAQALALEYAEELQAGDFRKGSDYGSPWECMHPDGDYRQNGIYMTSITGPLAAFCRLGWCRK